MPQVLSTFHRGFWRRHVCAAATRRAADELTAMTSSCGPEVARRVWAIGAAVSARAFLRRLAQRAPASVTRAYLAALGPVIFESDEFSAGSRKKTDVDWYYLWISRMESDMIRDLVACGRLYGALSCVMRSPCYEYPVIAALADAGDYIALTAMLHATWEPVPKRARSIMRAITATGDIDAVKRFWPYVRPIVANVWDVFDGAPDPDASVAILGYLLADGANFSAGNVDASRLRDPAVIEWAVGRGYVSAERAAHAAILSGDLALVERIVDPDVAQDVSVAGRLLTSSCVNIVKWAARTALRPAMLNALHYMSGSCILASVRALLAFDISPPVLNQEPLPRYIDENGTTPDYAHYGVARWAIRRNLGGLGS